MAILLRLLAALHRRGFHAAVLAGLIMMPAVIGVGFVTDRAAADAVLRAVLDNATARLRGSFAEGPSSGAASPVAF